MKTTIQQRIEILKEKGAIEIINTLPEVKYIKYLECENLEDESPVFSCRKYDWGTPEYIATYLLDCHFGAKSKVEDVANEYENQFLYLAESY